MKQIFTIAFFLLPLTSFASIINFTCKSTDVPGVHHFEGRGVVVVDEYNKVDGVISLQVEKAQAPGSVQIFEALKVEGSLSHYEPGQVRNLGFDQLILKSNDSYIKSLNLLLDLNAINASQIFTVDNFLYRSECVTESVQ
jgi:hypothetical protein